MRARKETGGRRFVSFERNVGMDIDWGAGNGAKLTAARRVRVAVFVSPWVTLKKEGAARDQ